MPEEEYTIIIKYGSKPQYEIYNTMFKTILQSLQLNFEEKHKKNMFAYTYTKPKNIEENHA